MKTKQIFTVWLLALLLFLMISNNAFCHNYESWIESCDPYRKQVESILKLEGVNTDFYYLMVAESRCTDKAKSKKGARGYWQLMPATAKHYGCHNPDNLECATKAAAKYLKKLSSEFSNFNDIIAAYNMGGHNYVKHGITAEALSLIARVNSIKQQDKVTKLANKIH